MDVNNKHDKFVRATFEDAERAKAFFEKFLPLGLRETIDLDSLIVLKESYITPKLDEYFSDLVFEANGKDTRKGKLNISLLFEHKSKPDKHVSVQVGKYVFLHLSQRIQQGLPLKPIIPIVYYQGKQKWNMPTISDLFEDYSDEVKEYLPIQKYVFIALNELNSDQLSNLTNSLLIAALEAQKNKGKSY